MKVIETAIPDIKIIELSTFGDTRGVFFENFHSKRYKDALNISENFVQDNFSRSQQNVLRGLHYQINQPQGKLVTVLSGKVFDIAVDMRLDSLTYGHWIGIELSDQNKRQLWIPTGFAHGFLVLSDSADFYYKCTDYYYPALEKTIIWNDPTLNIPWPLQGSPIVSEKDQKGHYFK